MQMHGNLEHVAVLSLLLESVGYHCFCPHISNIRSTTSLKENGFSPSRFSEASQSAHDQSLLLDLFSKYGTHLFNMPSHFLALCLVIFILLKDGTVLLFSKHLF